jgi:GNAT superfamily N-acetyltransferase
MALPVIRPMTAADVGEATALLLRGEWGDRRTWFEFATSEPNCRPIVAEAEGELVGTGVGSAHGPVGWVGTIYVAPDRRRHGFGRALTEAVADGLEATGCRTLLLVSTEEGLPLYRSLGFEVQTHYRILEAPGFDTEPARADTGSGPIVRPFAPADLAGMTELDARATGEARGHLIERFASPASSRVVAGPDGEVRGFVVRAPWGGGATVASDIEAAVRIAASRRAAPRRERPAG